MNLREWITNSEQVNHETASEDLAKDELIKVLGRT